MEFEGLKKNSTETHVDQTPNLVQALDQQELVVIIVWFMKQRTCQHFIVLMGHAIAIHGIIKT